MRNTILHVCLGVIVAGSSLATPDHEVTVVERYYGSNGTDYALVRTELDNLSSYYQSRTTTWLDEYAKDDQHREKPRSTLLLDVTKVVDANHNDPDTPPAIVETVNFVDSTIPLATLVQRYPQQVTEPWMANEVTKSGAGQSSVILYKGREWVVSDALISQVIFGGRHPGDEEWRLDGVNRDSNCIYLQLSIGRDAGPETRWMCIPPASSIRLFDKTTMEAVYLVAGTFETKDEAIQRARGLRTLSREKKLFGFEPEVWLMDDNANKPVYLLVAARSAELIRSGGIPKMEEALEIDFLPMSSDRFVQRMTLGGG